MDEQDQDTAALLSIAFPKQAEAVSASALAQLVGVLGDAVSPREASQLLFKARGDVTRAINCFYDPGASTHQQQAEQPLHRAAASQPAPSGSAAPARGSKRKPAGPLKGPSPAGKKARGAAARIGQRQITAFFAAPDSALAQQVDEPPQLASVLSHRAEALPQTSGDKRTPRIDHSSASPLSEAAACSRDGKRPASRLYTQEDVQHPSAADHSAPPDNPAPKQAQPLATSPAGPDSAETAGGESALHLNDSLSLAAGHTTASDEVKQAKYGISLPPAPLFAKAARTSTQPQHVPEGQSTPHTSLVPSEAQGGSEMQEQPGNRMPDVRTEEAQQSAGEICLAPGPSLQCSCPGLLSGQCQACP